MATITNAGVGSGNDFESIIQAMLSTKKSNLTNRVTKAKAKCEIELDGVKKMKSALNTFQTASEEMCKANAMNTHKVTTSQSKDYEAFKITQKEDCSNTNFDITVTQLAQSEAVTQKFNTADGFNNSFGAGHITIDLGPETFQNDRGEKETRERKFEIDISEGDTIELVRKRLNKNDLGVNVNLIKTSSGYTFSVDGGTTGVDTTNMKITATPSNPSDTTHDSISVFNFDRSSDTEVNAEGNRVSTSGSKWAYRESKDAEILIDGESVTSHTNQFDEQISGITLEVLKLSEKETIDDGSGNVTTGFKSYSVNITTDADEAYNKMNKFVEAYNTLQSTLTSLYKHNTYSEGKNQLDGGDLAGDSQVKGIQNALQTMISRFNKTDDGGDGSSSGSNKTIFDCGLTLNKDGTLALDKTKFTKAINESFNSVVNLFSSEDGLLKEMSNYVEDYTETGGLLSERVDDIQKQIDSWTDKEEANTVKLEQYEAMLRKKYGNLDSLMAKYSTSSTYISQIMSSIG